MGAGCTVYIGTRYSTLIGTGCTVYIGTIILLLLLLSLILLLSLLLLLLLLLILLFSEKPSYHCLLLTLFRVCVENHFYCGTCYTCQEGRGDICAKMDQ